MLENGRRLDVILNSLGVINRLNSAQLFEVSINFIADRIIERMRTMDNRGDMEKLLWQFIDHFNERGMATKVKEYYKNLSPLEKDEFFESIFKSGIFINIPPISTQEKPIFDILNDIYKEFDWIKPYDVYIDKWGRRIKMLHPLIVGEQYIIRLKQTAKKNFSARSTGYLSQKGLPDKSNKSKHNQQLYSTTPIKIGRDENNNLSIGIDSFTLAKFHLFYRSSPAARREIEKLYTKNPLNFKKFKIKKRFKNRNVEILSAYFKSFGRKLDAGFGGLRVDAVDSKLHEFTYKGRKYITTYMDMRQRLLDERWRKNFNRSLHVGTKEQLDEAYKMYTNYEKARISNKLAVNCGFMMDEAMRDDDDE